MIDPTLPLIDLHRHLDGCVRLETILDLGRQHGVPLPDWEVESLRPHVQVTGPQPGVMAFIAKFRWMTAVMVDNDACRRIAYEAVEDARREGLDYVELRFSPWFMAEPNRLDPEVVLAKETPLRNALFDVLLSLVEGGIEYLKALCTAFDEPTRRRMVKTFTEARRELKGRLLAEGGHDHGHGSTHAHEHGGHHHHHDHRPAG